MSSIRGRDLTAMLDQRCTSDADDGAGWRKLRSSVRVEEQEQVNSKLDGCRLVLASCVVLA